MAFAAIINLKHKKSSQPAPNINNLSAEDLLETIVGLPLSEILSAGDSIEIVVSANTHPIARRKYVATDWHSMIKLESAKTIKG